MKLRPDDASSGVVVNVQSTVYNTSTSTVPKSAVTETQRRQDPDSS
jgi:hypothetical protein